MIRWWFVRGWSRRWDVPGAWVLGEVLDHVESWLCTRGRHTRRCGRGSARCALMSPEATT